MLKILIRTLLIGAITCSVSAFGYSYAVCSIKGSREMYSQLTCVQVSPQGRAAWCYSGRSNGLCLYDSDILSNCDASSAVTGRQQGGNYAILWMNNHATDHCRKLNAYQSFKTANEKALASQHSARNPTGGTVLID